MSTILIIILLAIVVLLIASLAVGRSTYQVESARDTEYLELEGDWVRYNVIGGGPPVVLVHGWLSSSRVWEQLAQRLSQRFTVYTLDLPGFGESDKPSDGYGVRYGSRLLFAFCAHFGLTRVNIIGHDLGGDMVMKLASDHPDVVGRIALVATPANEEQIDLPTSLWAATLPVVGSLFYALGRAVKPVRSSWMKAFVSEPEDVTEEMIEDSASSTPAAMSKTLSVSKREIAGGRLARQARMVRVPVLILTGEEDQIVDPQAAGVWSRSLEQSEVCLMDECGHMPMIERTGEFNAQILAFLTGDARYLEYAEQSPSRNPLSQVEAEEDTIEVGTLAPEGEDPAFGGKGLFSPRSRVSNEEAEENPEDRKPSARFRSREARNRSVEHTPGFDESRPPDGEAARDDLREGGFSETDPAPAEEPTFSEEGRNASDKEDRPETEFQETSSGDERGEEAYGSGKVRRFGGEKPPSKPSVHRRRRPWNFDEPEETSDGTEDLSSGRYNDDLDDFSGGAQSGVENDREGNYEVFSGGEDEVRTRPDDDRGEQRDPGIEPVSEEPPRRVRRRGRAGSEGVPEVPEGLFDWGKSLDDIDFEPVDRSRRRGRVSEEGEGSPAPEQRRGFERQDPEDGDFRPL